VNGNTDHSRHRGVDKRCVAVQIQPKDALAGRIQQILPLFHL